MPRVKCPKCSKVETVLRAGFLRGKQRYSCKECNYHFTLYHDRNNDKTAKRKNHQTTIVDIAKAMGLAVSTVSRALRDHPETNLQTRIAVKKIAEELNYQPNSLAQRLSKRETQTIGVIIPNIEIYFFSSILTGIQHVASEAGYKVMVCQSNESHKTEVEHTHALMTNWVDGLIICHSKETSTFDHIKMYLKKNIPIIHFDRVCEEVDTPRVLLDDTEGSFQVTEHLITQGCKRIAAIAGPEHLFVSKKRLAGYLKALEKYDIAPDPSLIFYSDLTVPSVLEIVDRILEQEIPVDAIFSIFDAGAIRVLAHLKQKGIKIPEDICVASFGNEPMGEFIEPSLTSFDPQTFKIGEEAAKLFLDRIIEGDDYKAKSKIVKGNLVIRKSTLRKM